MKKEVTKAIFPVAGLGTRFLPATKSIPKEILTLVDRPLIQYAIDDARAAGITEFIFVTARGKGALEDYFDRAPLLEATLREAGKTKLLETLTESDMESGAIAYIRQHRALGLGHAVWCARKLIANEPFAVILPDDVIDAETSCMRQMVDAHAETGGNMVAAMEVSHDQVGAYGILDVGESRGRVRGVTGMVEKPAPEDAPSNIAAIGRYILTPRILGHLGRLQSGAGGEIQLTDAIAREIAASDDVNAFLFSGQRYDCGSKSGFLRATVALALGREDLRDDLGGYIDEIAHARMAAQ